ncbi:flagellar transcriptional regulator FlhD [Yersinia massiliensis]|jgi:flagellar transcriptional activator FlhD|uniref:Flagellar transcriptional regulator FlhD n=3 Tax=Yersinia TaxID=629 RepID=A0A0T9QK35_9GAMM|nr:MULTISPECIES: flagellar transcriptional regulator FlhD [Yersinia]HEI6967170.1 flagellar transcriptional regulator FlhD [Yersinia enterocolitica]ATM87334.1 flagellar transcriptional regulator FlhD [Yersinia frederiksenii]AVX36861.1 flagellar transcriptional regulator FlhD [Yersinia massiliensis]MCB5309544.1 flagellar transcriptional regulator FlhD [Yersinia massiliensis]MCB5317854.1 flagellar transcriptional regulator FlhD [Yersinia massiliensis]
MNTVDYNELLQNIHDINLSYLLLAQQLIRDDKFTSGFRLGLEDSTIEMLKDLSLPKLIKLSTSGQLICRLRLDNEAVINCLTRDSRIDALQRIHTGIILSTDLLDSLSDNNSAAS